MREAIIKDSTKSVPDQYHHLFMDLDEEEEKQPKVPIKRIKTITIKKKSSGMKSKQYLDRNKSHSVIMQKSHSKSTGLSKNDWV